MNIYFAGSIRGGRDKQQEYRQIIEQLKQHGTVLTEHVGKKNLQLSGSASFDTAIYKQDTQWIDEADVLVAEVTTPSLGVGYEIGYAEKAIPVLCIFKEDEGANLSAMILGNARITTHRYTDIHELPNLFDNFFRNLQ